MKLIGRGMSARDKNQQKAGNIQKIPVNFNKINTEK